ncbi:LytTR family DNA-binding domain-containing protein [Aerococcus sp. UMB7834]|uniref:LytR/AlgR family response regulator transcription factor n=1 Tax=Aerococcus sp. UMB7834 TaxID=3046342 RepID=UPI00254C51A5|nr:LytTR family DNA-binding domain-containing protein [Aerococcus sp. UMB7834]MDK6805692.1 LytTR family DNA-binding domain-containing protein [Aerococcus sp. UMB7834]
MLSIYICEDNDIYREKLEEKIANYLMINDYDLKIAQSTAQGTDILKEIQASPKQEALYILDIDLGDQKMNGLALGGEIRQYDPYACIVFLTSHSEMMPYTFTYAVEALDYIIKDSGQLSLTRLQKAIDTYYKRYTKTQKAEKRHFVVRVADTSRIFPIDDILYFENSEKSHKVRLVHKQGEIEFRSQLSEIEAVQEVFFRCHQSYVVNLEQIESVDHKLAVLHMVDGSQCLVAHRKKKALMNKLKSLS